MVLGRHWSPPALLTRFFDLINSQESVSPKPEVCTRTWYDKRVWYENTLAGTRSFPAAGRPGSNKKADPPESGSAEMLEEESTRRSSSYEHITAAEWSRHGGTLACRPSYW